MSEFKLTTPVAFIIFNRPDTTEQVFAEIRKAQPSKLLVIADGPRVVRPGEAEKCAQTRAIIDKVDWECEVIKNYSEDNLGCKMRVSSGLDWVFDTVDEAIILEDDCLPHPTFFQYCQDSLDYYRDDERIMMISGDNFHRENRITGYSYYYSVIPHIWGWASWRRAWKHYDVDMALWPEIRDSQWLKEHTRNKKEFRKWERIFEDTYNGKIDTWDYQWCFACWLQNTLNIMPNINLISNIGFREDATHTTQDSIFANIPIDNAMKFPLQHPRYMIRNYRADEFDSKLRQLSLLMRIKNKLNRIIGVK